MLARKKLVRPSFTNNESSELLTIDRRNAIILPVPRYNELSTKAVWNFVKEVPDLMNYFPDINDKDLPDRAYM